MRPPKVIAQYDQCRAQANEIITDLVATYRDSRAKGTDEVTVVAGILNDLRETVDGQPWGHAIEVMAEMFAFAIIRIAEEEQQ